MIWIIILLNISFFFIDILTADRNICGLSYLNQSTIIPFVANLTVKSQFIFMGKLINKNCSTEADKCSVLFRVSNLIKNRRNYTFNKKIEINVKGHLEECSLASKRKYFVFGSYNSIRALQLNYILTQYSKKLLNIVKDYSCKKCGRKLSMVFTNLVEVKEGDHVRITCRGVGQPHLQITWFKNLQPLLLNRPLNGKISWLEFKSVKLSDSGIYQCKAFNDFQSSNIYNTTLIVLPHQQIHIDENAKLCKDKSYCFHNGTCYIYETSRIKFCSCLDGYGGLRCQHTELDVKDLEMKSPAAEDSDEGRGGKILLFCLIFLLVVLLFVLVVLICAYISVHTSVVKLKKSEN